jgi:hypothetical protein
MCCGPLPVAFRTPVSNDPIETILELVVKARRQNLLLIVFGGAWLAACGSESNLQSPPVLSAPVAPAPNSALAGARAAAGVEKLIGSLEISEVRQAKSLGQGEYMLCIRGSRSPTDPPRTYAVFFHNNEYRDTRPSIIMDECEMQTYIPLPAGPAAAAPANPSPATTKHGKHHHKTDQ